MKKSFFINSYYDYDKEIKEKYGDKSVVFFQKGKFFELYSISPTFPKLCELMNLTCTKVNKKNEVSAECPYMAGFLVDTLDKFSRPLLNNNYTIIVVEETDTDFKSKKKIRTITKVLSPSTYIDSISEDIKPLLSIYISNEETVSYSSINLSTGIVYFHPDHTFKKFEKSIYLSNIIEQINPSEILFSFESEATKDIFENDEDFQIFMNSIKLKNILVHKGKVIASTEITKIKYQNEFLEKIYKINTIGISAIEFLNLSFYNITSLILLFQFAIDHEHLLINKIKKPSIINNNDIVNLTENTITQLHLYEIIKHISFVQTKMGSRLLEEYILYPIHSVKKLNNRYNNIKYYQTIYTDNNKLWLDIIDELKTICDIDKLFRKLCNYKIQYNELIVLFNSIKSSLRVLQLIENKDKIDKYKSTIHNLNVLIKQFQKNIMLESIDNTIFNIGIYLDLDKLYLEESRLKNRVDEINLEISNLDSTSSGEVENKKLKVGTCNDSLYFITTKTKASILKKEDKQNQLIIVKMQSETRISTNELNNIAILLSEVRKNIQTLNNKYFKEFCSTIINLYTNTIYNISKIISEIDLYSSCVEVINKYNFTIPIISTTKDRTLIIKEIRHPLVEKLCSDTFVTNDIELNSESSMLLYGVNYSGKTILLKSVCLSLILAQAGLPIPATKMTYYPYKNIITKIAISDNLLSNQSLFTNEIREIKNMIDKSNSDTIIFADELCNGTEYNSAISLVSATILSIIKNNCPFIFTTHFHSLVNDITEIKELICDSNKLKIYHMKVRIEDKLIFDRKLCEGIGIDKYGIEIAQYMKLPTEFIYLANTIRNKLEGKELLVSTKTSRYNSSVYMTECRNCKSNNNLHTHHIVYQSNYKQEDVRKHYSNNLMVLCEKCHVDIHSNKLKINDIK